MTSAFIPSMPTTSSSPTSVSPGRTTRWGERPAPSSGPSMIAARSTMMMSAGIQRPSPGGAEMDGSIPSPEARRKTSHARTAVQTTSTRRRRRSRRRSWARATSALGRMEAPTAPSIAWDGGGAVSIGRTAARLLAERRRGGVRGPRASGARRARRARDASGASSRAPE
jgi:hypothetical protein